MNGKKAKKLRRKAAELTVGAPVVDYTIDKVLNHKRNSYRPRSRMVPFCTRSVLKSLKRAEDRQ